MSVRRLAYEVGRKYLGYELTNKSTFKSGASSYTWRRPGCGHEITSCGGLAFLRGLSQRECSECQKQKRSDKPGRRALKKRRRAAKTAIDATRNVKLRPALDLSKWEQRIVLISARIQRVESSMAELEKKHANERLPLSIEGTRLHRELQDAIQKVRKGKVA